MMGEACREEWMKNRLRDKGLDSCSRDIINKLLSGSMLVGDNSWSLRSLVLFAIPYPIIGFRTIV